MPRLRHRGAVPIGVATSAPEAVAFQGIISVKVHAKGLLVRSLPARLSQLSVTGTRTSRREKVRHRHLGNVGDAARLCTCVHPFEQSSGRL